MVSQLNYTVIKDRKQYNEYCDLLEKLVFSEFREQYEEHIELLTLIIEKYQDENSSSGSDLDPVEMIKILMDDHDMNRSQLAKEMNVSRSLITEILSYKKAISKDMVRKLSERFKVRPEAFLKTYHLRMEQTH